MLPSAEDVTFKYSLAPRFFGGFWSCLMVRLVVVRLTQGCEVLYFVDAVSCNSVKIPGNCKRNPNFDG